jgi:2-iminobutanoate/2-iminopropanoate deaminase
MEEKIMKYISTEKAPKAIGPYSQAVVAEKFVFVSGQLPIDPATGNLVEGTIEKKTERIFENIKFILESAGSSLASVVKVTVFIKDMENFSRVNAVYERYFDNGKPARSFVEVSNLPRNADIEIELIAWLN